MFVLCSVQFSKMSSILIGQALILQPTSAHPWRRFPPCSSPLFTFDWPKTTSVSFTQSLPQAAVTLSANWSMDVVLASHAYQSY